MKNKYVTEYVPEEGVFLVSYPKFHNKQSLSDYIVSYDETIDLLIKPILDKGQSDAPDDMALIPALYLLRHTIELDLKKMLYVLYARFDGKAQIDNGHNLNIIYDNCIKFFNDVEILKDLKSKFQECRSLIKFFPRL
jgi:hypothetical protein